jgi:hypothetical protein
MLLEALRDMQFIRTSVMVGQGVKQQCKIDAR